MWPVVRADGRGAVLSVYSIQTLVRKVQLNQLIKLYLFNLITQITHLSQGALQCVQPSHCIRNNSTINRGNNGRNLRRETEDRQIGRVYKLKTNNEITA